MAPMKRSRARAETEDAEVFDIETAQSSLRQTSKRARLSYHEPEDEISEDDDDNDSVIAAQETQYATQQRRKQYVDNVAADNGILESVTCTNFMCHGHLEVTLCPLINFIIGHNGSGKSAVLTAITICLGGKATATNRGQSLKSFIKEGEESTILSVKIKNAGITAYQQEVYGNSIIVERHFSRSGQSGFKLKSSSGRLISTRKFDLDEICDYYALQIDNPMNVLTQDMARQFLNSSNPSDKYKFFMKGTQLEHLDADYRQMEESIDQIDDHIIKIEKDVEVYREDEDKKRKLRAASDKHNTLRFTIRDMSRQMAWVQVEEPERRLAEREEMCDKAKAAFADADRNETETTEAFATSDQNHDLALAGVREAQASLEPINEEKAQAKTEFDKTKAEAMDVQAQQRSIRAEMKAAEQRIDKARKDIDEENRRLMELDGGSHARRLAEIEEKKTDAADARTQLEEHEASANVLQERKRRADEAAEQARGPINAKKGDIRACERQLDELIKDKGRQQAAFLAGLPRLLSAIQQDRGFRRPPIGPLGKHVRLMKPKWSSILERSFGGALNSFIVTCKEDQTRLATLMRQFSCVYPIFIGNDAYLDTTGHEPDPAYDTTLRVLEIDDDLVRRQMIISQSIEQTLLIEDRETAIDLLNNSRVPNVKQCFSMNNKPGAGLRFNYGYGGGLGQNYVAPFTGPPRMGTDIEYQINFQRETLNTLKSELHELEGSLRGAQKAALEASQALNRQERETKNLRIAMQRAEDVVGKLQDAIEEDRIEEGRLQALKDHLKEAQDELVVQQGSYEESVLSKDNANESLKTAREQLTALDARIEEANTKLEKAESRALKCKNKRQADLMGKNAAINRVKDTTDRLAHDERKRQEIVNIIEANTREASKISARVAVPAGETAESLDAKLKKLNRDLDRGQERLGASEEKIIQDLADAVKLVHDAEAQEQEMEHLAQELKMTLLDRKDRWKLFQKKITARARIQFSFLLTERNYRGRLKADHQRKTLDLSVEPDSTRIKSEGRKILTLSGGEKSFSTTCLLLSLWDAMGAPVRCLDEFDVFMDSANRDVALDLITKAARDSIGKQFIFITPGVMSNMRAASDVKVHRMIDPERGQTTIQFPEAS